LLELYEEEKTAIINQAVTKGLDPDAPMKDSGIEWLGEVPAEWEVKRLRYLGWCQNGIGISSDAFGKGYPFVSYSDVGNNETIPIEVKGLVESSSSDRRKYSVEEGDVFFTRTSETVEEIAYASTCLKTIEDAVFAGFLIRWRPFSNLLDNRFKKYYFRAQVHRRFFVKEMNLVTRASLSQELLKKLPVLIPPLEEQQHIAHHIETECAGIDAKIAKTEKLIALLTEYRTALISEVVTGKLKVTA
jgi:type I restriction enzyme S subunit